ncbi:hypothetical protein [Citrobacter sp. RHBSTW-00229]|uniref:hypothetical protein n=1 Tax=Citrobacter sp. RHBSTW-00229 TaxID=2742641 RepID=UPI002017E314|nr:hypothetical protein [Citrobacter sp. RHBSTW-00229]
MSKIVRYQGDVRAFASDAQGMERTVFGGTNQADDLTSQITASFLRGWGIVGASEHPSLEDFNAAMYAMSQFIAYQHQMGVPEWHAEQEYHIGSICTHNGESYQSLQNANIGSQPPSAKWTPVLTSKNGLANLQLQETVKEAAGSLQKGNNFSDVENIVAARLNLQLGDSAILNVGKVYGSVASGDSTFGIAQQYKDVTSSRVLGVTYTNTTSRAIMILVTLDVPLNGRRDAVVGGVITSSFASSNSASQIGTVYAVVPPGVTYSIAASIIPGGSLIRWMELSQ